MSVLKPLVAVALFAIASIAPRAQQRSPALQTQETTLKALSMPYQIRVARAAADCADPVVVVIVDSEGNVRMQLVGDGANSNDLDKARRMARTSAMMHRSTEEIASARKNNPAFHLPPDPEFLLIPGAVPLQVQGEAAGAVAVYGRRRELLDGCARHGADQLSNLP